MNELNFKRKELSHRALEILDVVDKYIDIIEARCGKGSVKSLPIHWMFYDDLDTSIKYHTEDHQSITDRTYRGCLFVRDGTGEP